MQIDVSNLDDVTLLVVNGRVDSSTADEFGVSLNEAISAGATQIVLDLQGVDYMSSAGLRQMISTLKQIKKSDGDLRLASPSERVQDVLELSGLNSIFSIYESQQDAISSFQPVT